MSEKFHTIESYVHHGRIGVLVEFEVESSFTVGVQEFKNLAKDLAVQVAAADPASIENLLGQSFVKDAALTVGQLLSNASAQLGETIRVTRFVRWTTEQRSEIQPTPPNSPAVVIRSGRTN